MTNILSFATTGMAVILLLEAARRIRDGYRPARLVFLCSMMYIVLELEWVVSGQAMEIGDLRNTAWTVVEFGMMLGFYLCSKHYVGEHLTAVRKFVREAGMSTHFSVEELKCKCGCERCAVVPELWTLAEKVRSVLGVPMIVTSGFRCPEHNAAVGGAPNSKHMSGMAMDFYPQGMSVPEAHHRILEAYNRGGLPELGGLGYYPERGFLHIDVYKKDHLRRWKG